LTGLACLVVPFALDMPWAVRILSPGSFGTYAVAVLLTALSCQWLGRFALAPPVPEDVAEGAESLPSEQGRDVQQWLRLLLALALLLPSAFFVATAWQSYRATRVAATERAERSAIVAREHALKLMHMNELVFDRLRSRFEGRDTADVLADRVNLELALARTADDLPDLRSLAVWSADGRLLASSEPSRSDTMSPMESRCAQMLHDGAPICLLSSLALGTEQGRAVGEPQDMDPSVPIVVARPRRTVDGRFDGLYVLGLEASSFHVFYKELLRAEHSGAIVLFREDGTMLLREPSPEKAGRWGHAPAPLMQLVGEGQPSGALQMNSAVDGRPRLLAFRRVGGYPLYVASSLQLDEMRSEWYARLALLAAFTFPTAFGLAGVSWIALKHVRRERLALARWRGETVKRVQVEDALRQTQRLEALGHLTGGVAHDVNNLLMVVSNNAYLLQRLLGARGQPVDARIAKPIDAILRAVTTGARLTRQLLAFARRQALRPEVIRLQDRMPQLLDLMRHSISALVTLEGHVAPDTPCVQVDPAELELALINLAVNARDAMPEGGQLSVDVRQARPEEHEGLGRWVSIEVRDTGGGIPADLLERVFEPFFTTKAQGQGTGLGLSQVYGFCQQAGGTARIASTLGRGTTVQMLLPAVDEAPEPEEETPPVPTAQGRLLLVEDNAEVAEATEPMLSSWGYAVKAARSGDAAKELLEQSEGAFDLLLTDIVMPGSTDGLSLARHVKRLYPGIGIVLMTGHARETDKAMGEGFVVLQKPWTPQALAEALEQAHPRSRAAGEGS
jgi:two-component system NtrC family sensor kinase